jgi:hypothetical protein
MALVYGFDKSVKQFSKRTLRYKVLFDLERQLITISGLSANEVKSYQKVLTSLRDLKSLVVPKHESTDNLITLNDVGKLLQDCPVGFDTNTGILDGFISFGEPNMIVSLGKITPNEKEISVKIDIYSDGPIKYELAVYRQFAEFIIDEHESFSLPMIKAEDIQNGFTSSLMVSEGLNLRSVKETS